MLQQISWSLVFELLAWTLIGYYLVIGYLFYQKETVLFIRSHFAPGSGHAKKPVAAKDPKNSEVKELVENLDQVFESAASKGMIREELLQAIKSKLKDYPQLQNKETKEELSEHIRIEAREQCGIEFSEAELKGIWR